MKAHFLRNTSPEPSKYLDGFKDEDPLVYVGFTEIEFSGHATACEVAFARFNRGSGREENFAGPSMSVGDLVVLEGRDDGPWSAWACKVFRFEPVIWQERFDEILDEKT